MQQHREGSRSTASKRGRRKGAGGGTVVGGTTLDDVPGGAHSSLARLNSGVDNLERRSWARLDRLESTNYGDVLCGGLDLAVEESDRNGYGFGLGEEDDDYFTDLDEDDSDEDDSKDDSENGPEVEAKDDLGEEKETKKEKEVEEVGRDAEDAAGVTGVANDQLATPTQQMKKPKGTTNKTTTASIKKSDKSKSESKVNGKGKKRTRDSEPNSNSGTNSADSKSKSMKLGKHTSPSPSPSPSPSTSSAKKGSFKANNYSSFSRSTSASLTPSRPPRPGTSSNDSGGGGTGGRGSRKAASVAKAKVKQTFAGDTLGKGKKSQSKSKKNSKGSSATSSGPSFGHALNKWNGRVYMSDLIAAEGEDPNFGVLNTPGTRYIKAQAPVSSFPPLPLCEVTGMFKPKYREAAAGIRCVNYQALVELEKQPPGWMNADASAPYWENVNYLHDVCTQSLDKHKNEEG